jgi:hypothetical protein
MILKTIYYVAHQLNMSLSPLSGIPAEISHLLPTPPLLFSSLLLHQHKDASASGPLCFLPDLTSKPSLPHLTSRNHLFSDSPPSENILQDKFHMDRNFVSLFTAIHIVDVQ